MLYCGCPLVEKTLPPDNTNDDSTSNDPSTTQDQADDDYHKNEATTWVEKLADPENDNDDNFLQELLTSMESKTMCWIVATITGAPFNIIANAAAKKKITKWLETEPARRPYQLLTNSKLLAIAAEKSIVIPSNKKKKDDIINMILNPPDPTNEPGLVELPDDKFLAPMVQLLEQSFLRPQKDKIARDAAFTGKLNEHPFIKAFWDECQAAKQQDDDNDFSKISLLAGYRPGLVKKKNNNFIKGSADGIFITKVSKSNRK